MEIFSQKPDVFIVDKAWEKHYSHICITLRYAQKGICPSWKAATCKPPQPNPLLGRRYVVSKQARENVFGSQCFPVNQVLRRAKPDSTRLCIAVDMCNSLTETSLLTTSTSQLVLGGTSV